MAERMASCSCGRLTVTLEGDPVRVSVCHCLACQRRTGSAFGVQARFNRSQVTAISGEWREYQRRADDDDEARNFHFCPVCGSTVFYDFGTDEDLIVIPVGAFADPEFPAPSRSIYESRQHDWVTVTGEDVEHHD